MILEVAILPVISGRQAAFELAFCEAQKIISAQPGYLAHSLHKNSDGTGHYLLQVTWTSIAHHREGFRQSTDYQLWKNLLHHFYDPLPQVDYYEKIY